jgi:XFP N-terminal domain
MHGVLFVNLRKHEGKTASLARASALCPNLATHCLGQGLSDRQTNAGSSKSARARLVDAIEAFEDMCELFWGKADAAIGDAQGHLGFLAAYSHLHATGSRRVTQRVDQQVGEDLHILERWMRSYQPEGLFDENGRLMPELATLTPKGDRRMGANPHANGGKLLVDLDLPPFTDYTIDIKKPAISDTRTALELLC